jgi:hypothetical protein
VIVPTLGAKKLPTRIQSIAAAYPHHRAVPFTEIGTKRLGVQCGMHCCLLRAWRVPQWRQLRAALVFSMRTRTLLCQWQCWNASVSCRHLCRLSGRSIARRMRGVCQRNLLARKRQCVFELPRRLRLQCQHQVGMRAVNVFQCLICAVLRVPRRQVLPRPRDTHSPAM